MPRTFSPAIQGEIDKRFAREPMVIVEVSWVEDSWIAYSDRKLNGESYPYPLLTSIAQFDSTQVVSNGTDNQQTSITLNDIDGTLRTLIDEHDIHLRPVRIYLTFQGLPFAEKALIFEGVINSDIIWDEGGRTLSFEVLSTIESVEAGFTMEDGDFPFIEPSDRNKPWPLVFGKVCNMEAVRVRGTRKGFLAEGVGVKDPTIEERLCQAKKLQCPEIENTANFKGEVGNTGETFNIGGAGGLPPNNVFNNPRQTKTDPQCVKRRFDKICEILTEKAQQEAFVKTTFTVRGGEEFPQEQNITIQINEVRFEGVMIGDQFTVFQTIYPNRPENPPCVATPEAGWGYRYRPGEGDIPDIPGCARGGDSFERDVQNGSAESWNYFNIFKRADFIWLPPGTEVLLADESEILNIVSLIPGTVDQVAAYRNFADTSLLMAVDTDRYTVTTTDFGGYEVVEVRLDAPLSTIEDEDWDDEIFVSFTSSIGPNPVDVVQWLVETYTDLSVDATSFASVKSSLTNYPSNFFVKARPRVFDLIRDVAYQARCAVFIRDNVVYMVYLSKEPSSVKTLTESDILPNSFRVGHTRTEDLETRTTIAWSEGEAGVFKTDLTDFEFVLKHNIPKYGVFDASYDYYTLNIFELVEKSSTFWSIRKSNTWKIVEFETPLIHLNLDVFDCVTLDLSQFGPVKVVITSAKFNLDTNTLVFQAWTPIRSGESSEYFWAWPALKDPNAIFPLFDDAGNESGDKFPLQVIPPIDHPLRGGFDPDSAIINTDGDRHPSDLGDTFPNIICKIATGAELQDQIEPDFDPFEPLAEDNFQDKLNNIEAGSLSFNLEDAESPVVCGEPTPGDACNYEVTVHYITPLAVTTRLLDGTPASPGCYGPCGCGSALGRPCFGPQHSFCHSFGAAFAATAFASQKKQEAAVLFNECRYPCLQTNVLGVSGIKSIGGNGPFGECDDPPGSPDAPGANEGQIQQPALAGGNPATAPASGDL